MTQQVVRTPDEIKTEINALKALEPKIRPESLFGDDNVAALNAQIETLERALANPEQVPDISDFDDDPTAEEYEGSTYEYDCAGDALAWLVGDHESPESAKWEVLS